MIRERGAAGPLAMEGTTRFFIVDQVRKALGGSREAVDGDLLVRACREVKSPAELALMQAANDVTLSALRHVHGQISAGKDAHVLIPGLLYAARSMIDLAIQISRHTALRGSLEVAAGKPSAEKKT